MASKRNHETEESDIELLDAPKAKKALNPRKMMKKTPVKQRFKKSYSEKYPVLKESVEDGPSHAWCEVCQKAFSIVHGGVNDCRRHVEGVVHVKKAKARMSTPTISTMFQNQRKSEAAGPSQDSVTKAAAILVSVCTEMNLPFTAAERFTKAAQVMFPDSAIAKKLTCGRTKAIAYVKTLAQLQKDKLQQKMKTIFTISTDGSNDVQNKQFPLVVRTVDGESGIVSSELLCVPIISGSATGENIFKLIQEEFTSNKVPWSHCLALGCDNAPVMTGIHKGVYGLMKKENNQLYLSGCVCHLIHITAQKAAACLPVNLEELVIDIYYYLDKSSKKQANLKMWQIHHDIKEKKMLKHVQTRWLSLGKCLPRILESWMALRDFIKEEAAASKSARPSSFQSDRLSRLKSTFTSPTAHLYCIFLIWALNIFDETNTLLQCGEPKIQSLRRVLHKLLRNTFERFLKPVALRGKLLNDVDFTAPCHMKEDEDLIIGEDARTFISKGEKHSLMPSRVEEFYGSVKKFYIQASTYMKQKLPLECELLKHAEVADPELQLDKGPSDLRFFLHRFKALMPPGATGDDILLEYSKFQALELGDKLRADRVDKVWQNLKELKDESGHPMFTYLPHVMQSILTIPHSSAHCERIFSCVRKNKTDQRPNLGPASLEALLVLKSAPNDALTRQYSSEELGRLKSCYAESLKKSD